MALAVSVLALALVGCGSSGNAAPGASGSGAQQPVVPSTSSIPGLTVAGSVSARVVVGGLGTLDDIVVAPDGTVYFGDERGGKLSAWSPATGQMRLVASRLSHPEGIVAIDGALIVCEQGKNQLSRVDPNDGSVTLFRALTNVTTNPGVDGLAVDPVDPSILVPDSPNGTLLRVSLDGATVTPIPVMGTSHPPFQRPTGAFVRSDGTVLVADEAGGDVALVRADTTLQIIATGLNLPDDVAGDERGNVYVNTLGDGVLHRIQGAMDEKLITGLDTPQGLAVDLDGNLLVTDLSGGGRLIKVVVH